MTDGRPTQHVSAHGRRNFEVTDLTKAGVARIETEARRIAQEFVEQEAPFCVGPLFDAKILKLSEQEHVVILVVDHMVSDGVSWEIMTREMWTLYRQATLGHKPALPELPIQFPDYAVWEQSTYSEWLREHGAYWKEKLSNVKPVRLPLDYQVGQFELSVAILHFTLDEALSSRLRDLASAQQAKLPLLILAIFLCVISEWSDKRDVLLQFASHNRNRPELSGMVGYVVNLLHFRIEVNPTESLLDLLARVCLEFQSATRHRDYDRVPDFVPGCETDAFFDWLPGTAIFGWSPVNCAFNWLPGFAIAESCATHDHALKIEPFPLKPFWRLPFTPFFYETASRINVHITYRRDLFAMRTMERFRAKMELVAEAFVRDPRASIQSAINALKVTEV
jgi:hypothetical protein